MDQNLYNWVVAQIARVALLRIEPRWQCLYSDDVALD